jgi:hypothetical protein
LKIAGLSAGSESAKGRVQYTLEITVNFEVNFIKTNLGGDYTLNPGAMGTGV